MNRLSFANPFEYFLFVFSDFFGPKQNVIGNVPGYHQDTVDVADDHIARFDRHVPDFDGDLIMGDQAPAKASVGYPVFVENGKSGVEDLILQDLSFARDNLTDSPRLEGAPTIGSANALLTEVCLWLGKTSDAPDWQIFRGNRKSVVCCGEYR